MEKEYFSKINKVLVDHDSYFPKSKEDNIFNLSNLIIDKDEDIEISELQRSYWKGGNKNELVVCLGIDSTKVKWCNAFSWCDVPTIDVKTETYFTQNDTLDLKAYSDLLRESLDNGEWVRKKFEDFSYLKPELSLTQQIWILVISILLNIGFAIFVIKNNFF